MPHFRIMPHCFAQSFTAMRYLRETSAQSGCGPPPHHVGQRPESCPFFGGPATLITYSPTLSNVDGYQEYE